MAGDKVVAAFTAHCSSIAALGSNMAAVVSEVGAREAAPG